MKRIIATLVVILALPLQIFAQEIEEDQITILESYDGIKPTEAPKVLSAHVNELYPSPMREYMNLGGAWELALDTKEEGLAKQWWDPDKKSYDDQITVPGCMEAQGKGLTQKPIEETDAPGWARNLADVPYEHISWHRKQFDVPAGWEGKELWLNFGGIAAEYRIWVNGHYLGFSKLAGISFKYNVSDLINYGAGNYITVALRNAAYRDYRTEKNHPYGLGVTSAFVNFQGIYRDVELVAMHPQHLEDVVIIPDVKTGSFHVKAGTYHKADQDYTVEAKAYDMDNKLAATATATLNEGDTLSTVSLKLDNAKLWSEEQPNLYRIETRLKDADGQAIDQLNKRTGLREFKLTDNQFRLNGQPTFLRGEMYHIHWPNTITPQTDRDDIKEKLQAYKDFGFNYLRCHTHIPHPEFTDVCDELGLLVHSEPGAISNTFPIPWEYAPDIWEGMLRRDRNHPSIVVWCMGNERPNGGWDDQDRIVPLYELNEKLDMTRLIQTNSPGYFLNPDIYKSLSPVIHEFGKWSSYPDPDTKPLYETAVRPWYVSWAEVKVKEAGLEGYLPAYVKNMQALQARSAKLGLEYLRFSQSIPGEPYTGETVYSGYEHCMVRDAQQFNWGVLDDYCRPKYVPAKKFFQYNGPSTLLLGKPDWRFRTFANGDEMIAEISLSHYYKSAIENGRLEFILTDEDGKEVYHETEKDLKIPNGALTWLAERSIPMDAPDRPVHYTLTARLTAEGFETTNQWEVWAFPDKLIENSSKTLYLSADSMQHRSNPLPYLESSYPFAESYSDEAQDGQMLVTGDWKEAVAYAQKGGHVLYLERYPVYTENYRDYELKPQLPGHPTSWVCARTETGWHGTIIKEHKIWEGFSHEGWCDLPFYRMLTHRETDAQELFTYSWLIGWDEFGWGWTVDISHEMLAGAKPLIISIPSSKDPEPKHCSPLFELPVDEGTIIVSSLGFDTEDPASRYFLNKIIQYMAVDLKK